MAIVTIFLLGILLIIASFLFTMGVLIERQILCYFFNWHQYKFPASYSDDYHNQALFCEHCNKIKWI